MDSYFDRQFTEMWQRGDSTATIARALNISDRTVRRVRERLGLAPRGGIQPYVVGPTPGKEFTGQPREWKVEDIPNIGIDFPLTEVSEEMAQRWGRLRRAVILDEAADFPSKPSRLPVPHDESILPANEIPVLGGNFLLLSDLHIPYHDPDFIERAIDHALSEGITQFIIVGDGFDANQFSKRGFELGWQRRWQDDVKVMEQMLAALLSVFNNGVFLLGNHDRWYIKNYRGHIDANFILPRLLKADDKRVSFTEFSQCLVISGGKEFRVLHGAQYSATNPLGVGQRYAAKYEQGIIMGHQHHPCHGKSWSGKHEVVCMGGCMDPEKLAYLHLDPQPNQAQAKSYCLLIDGKTTHIIE